MTEDEAHQSVAALIADLRHVMGSRPHTAWAAMAAKVLAHHSPPIAASLLDGRDQRLQQGAIDTLEGLLVSDVDSIRASILKIRAVEAEIATPGAGPGRQRPQRPASPGAHELIG